MKSLEGAGSAQAISLGDHAEGKDWEVSYYFIFNIVDWIVIADYTNELNACWNTVQRFVITVLVFWTDLNIVNENKLKYFF